MRSQVIEIKEIECITIAYNNLTEAESPVPPVSLNLFLQTIGGIRPVFFMSIHFIYYFSNK
ncbi:hypothetical protein B1J94_16610 [Leptospira kirschneri serovar Grippotyphosa]|nr:hypothetical protein B1J94_16610 [Leptospira kirschneri serovar Grippotyphosa]